MGSDLLKSFVVSVIMAISLANFDPTLAALPLWVAEADVIMSVFI